MSEPARAPVRLAEGAPVFTPFSQDMAGLRAEVALICGSARANRVKDPLPSLVTDIYLSGVDPAMATEALIQADCAPLAAIVREMIAQGGDQAVSAVVGRALFLGGPSAARTIETAASAGLDRNLGSLALTPAVAPGAAPGASPGVAGGGSLGFAMAYFPSRAEAAGLETATAVSTLYSNATPGYGIYTFVLLGGAFDPQSPADQSRYRELLRVVETYVLAAEQGARGPSPESHAFLIAVQPERRDVPLIEQTGPELSAAMRRDLAGYLRAQGQPALAQRLEDRPGPFLVSSLEPRLMPTSRVAPRLIVDLSAVGAEYMYAVVDAYDQPVPAQTSGRPESLGAVRERLLGLFQRRVPDEDLAPSIKDAWVFRLGGPPPGDGPAKVAAATGEAGGAPEAIVNPTASAAPPESDSAPRDREPPHPHPQVQTKQPTETPAP